MISAIILCSCSNSASGLLTQSVTMGHRFALRDYVADRVFSTGELLYSYFPGGYFDADGAPHYLHTDYQGSVVMVTDSAGTIEQHTSNYPSGEPILYGGKERLTTTDDYNFDARRYHAPTILMSAPDPCAAQFPHLSPFIYCAGNPIKYTDVTGCVFTKESLGLLSSFMAETQRRKVDCMEQIELIKSRLSNSNIQEYERKDLLNRLDNLTNEKSVYEAATMEVFTLIASSQTYHMDYKPNAAEDVNYAAYNPDTGNFDMVFTDKAVPYLAHELKHAYQFDSGTLSTKLIASEDDNYNLYDQKDEWEAYKRQAVYENCAPIQQLPDLYDIYSPNDINILQHHTRNSSELQFIATFNHMAFRLNGKTYVPPIRKRK